MKGMYEVFRMHAQICDKLVYMTLMISVVLYIHVV